MNKLIYFILIISLICSCEKTINVKIPDDGRKIVLNSVYYSDSLLIIDLSISKHVMDPDYTFLPVENAHVSLFENGNPIRNGSEGTPGIYYFDYKIVAGNNYKIEASADNLESITCESIAPLPIQIENISLSYQIEGTDDYKYIKNLDFDIQIKDDESKENFYMMQVALQLETTVYNSETGEYYNQKYLNPILIETKEPYTRVNPISRMGYGMTGIVFDDAVFNGKQHTLKIYSDNLYLNNAYSTDPNVKIYFYVSSMTKELYFYYLSLNKYHDIDGNPFAEPVQIYSNINNGFGIFGGSAVAIDSTIINLEEILGNK